MKKIVIKSIKIIFKIGFTISLLSIASVLLTIFLWLFSPELGTPSPGITKIPEEYLWLLNNTNDSES